MPILLYSYSWFIYNFVILFLLFLVCVNKKIKKSSYFIIFVFFIIFSVYGYITADYNSYLELMKMSKVNESSGRFRTNICMVYSINKWKLFCF